MIAFGDDLDRILAEYVAGHQLCAAQQERLALHVERLRAYCGGNVFRHDIDTALLNDWLSSLDGMAPATVNGHRQSIVSLLRYSTEDGEPLPRSDRIRRQREPEKINHAFTLDEIRRMLLRAPHYQPITRRTYGRGLAGDERPRHRPDGVPWSIWWAAYVRLAYNTGQYMSDLKRLRWADIARDGTCTLSRHKTGRLLSFRLTMETRKACRRIRHGELVAPWTFDLRAYFAREFAKFCRFAEVRTLGPKALRRSAVTYTYMEQGEEAARILAGHKSFSTTARHYVDWSIARRPIVEPPRL